MAYLVNQFFFIECNRRKIQYSVADSFEKVSANNYATPKT